MDIEKLRELVAEALDISRAGIAAPMALNMTEDQWVMHKFGRISDKLSAAIKLIDTSKVPASHVEKTIIPSCAETLVQTDYNNAKRMGYDACIKGYSKNAHGYPPFTLLLSEMLNGEARSDIIRAWYEGYHQAEQDNLTATMG